MLPGKKYKPEDIVTIARSRVWVLLVPFAVISAGTAVVVRKLPDRYRSEASIRVIPQQVPEAYVKSAVTVRLDDRLAGIAQTILSRTRLEHIIEEHNLYADERRTGIMEDIIQQMRDRDIKFETKNDSFTLKFEGSNPTTVMKVTEELAGLFVQESKQDRETLTQGTTQFLEAQLEDARRRLLDQEKKLQDYKLKFSGQLPTQLESNLQAVSNTQLQIQNLNQSLDRARGEKLLLDRQLATLQDDETVASTSVDRGVGTPDGPSPNGTTAQRLAFAQKQLANLRLAGFGDSHPDVKVSQGIIKELASQLEKESLARPVSVDEPVATLSPSEKQRRQRIQDLKEQKEQLEKSIAAGLAEEKRLQGNAAAYQKRIELVPERESELVALTRDYGVLQNSYFSLLGKKEEANLAANLENRQIGEQFKPIDSARLPERPSSPNRPLLNLFGMAVGFGIGLGLVVLLEYRDASFKTDDEITRLLALPVLAVVPFMESDQEHTRSLRRRLYIGFGLGTAVVGCLAVLVYTFVR